MDKKQKKTKNLYDFDYESSKEKKMKAKKRKADAKSASKKKKQDGQAPQRKKYDDEIIIGVTRYPDKKNIENKTKPKKEKIKDSKVVTKQSNLHINNRKTIKNEMPTQVREEKNKKKNGKIIKIALLLILIVSAIVFALLSPIFNIQNITITGNEQVTKEELKSLSGIKIDDNIFKVQNKKIANNIKQNAYINQVEVHKILPNTIKIEVVEREPNYLLEYGNGYVYVSKQGYMLEISSIKKELPILIGTSTSKEDYKDGNRLNEEDLVKLGTVIKIMKAAQTNGIEKLITKIDISDSNNYILYLETENKVAYLGDCSNLETRMLFLVGILEKEKENSGEIFINMNLNTDDAYFRESV